MKRCFAIGFVFLLASTLACAASRGDVRKQIESSLLVSGWIDIDTAGHVERYELDRRGKLPQSVRSLLDARIPEWTFEPILVEGSPIRARTNMSVRVVARKVDADHYGLSLRSAHFTADKASDKDLVTAKSLPPPDYPWAALRRNVHGTVYLLLKVGLDGAVQDVVTEQVNLRSAGSEGQMDRGREALSRAARAAAQRWTFNVPASAAAEAPNFRSVRVPVDFQLGTGPNNGYGRWDAYIPGPRQQAPWMLQDIDPRDRPDAMIAGGVYEVGTGPKLLTPLDSA